MGELAKKHCKPCEGNLPTLTESEARIQLNLLENWSLNDQSTRIKRHCKFENHYETMAFVNAVAWISHREDHHPVLEIGYNYCIVQYSTHAIKGLSENDFICAAKVDVLLATPDESASVCELKSF
jgi:4a-hydroxytetrahydrobiopterin dehydratase